MSIQYMKTVQPYYDDVESGHKTFEVRIDDRIPPYSVGDTLVLQEYTDKGYTGKELIKTATYVLRDPNYCKDGFCIIGLSEPPKECER